ncbi:MAG: peptidoglycan-binding protein [Pseudomonadota bacterium]
MQQRLDERLRELQARSGRLSNAMRQRPATPAVNEIPEETQPPQFNPVVQPETYSTPEPAPSAPEPAPAPEPATVQAPPQSGSPELSRIRDRLDVLAQKLQSAADQAASPVDHEPAMEQPVENASTVQETAPEHVPSYNEDIQAEEGPATGQSTEEFQQMSADLHAVREAMEEILHKSSDPVDMESISQSIKSGYSEIASMLESHFDRLGPDASWNKEQSGQLSSISDHVSALREAVNSMQTGLPSDGLSERIDEISKAIAHFASKDAETSPQQLQAIEGRLDELTRAIVAISANPVDHEDSIHRLEARLTAITKTVDEIAETSRQAAIEQALPREIEDLAGLPQMMTSSMEKVEARLSAMENADGSNDQAAAQLVAQIAELTQKIDQMVESGNVDQQDEAAIVARFDAIDARLEQLAEQVRTNSSQDGTETLNLIESQIVALNDRLEKLLLDRQRDSISEREAEVLSILEALSTKVEQIDANNGAQATEFASNPALEQQLAAIASQLQTISTGGTDFSPVEQRLESIEQQIALSRDLAIDVAGKAAEQAIQSSNATGGTDAALVDPLIQELRNLEQKAQEMDQRNYDGFSALHEIMDRISARLDLIENATIPNTEYSAPQPVQSEPQVVSEQQFVQEEPEQAVVEPSEAVYTEPEAVYSEYEAPQVEEAPASVSERLSSLHETYEEQQPTELEELDQPEEQLTPPDNEEFIEALAEMPAPETISTHKNPAEETPPAGNSEIEDVPLEPGSGVPDLAALVRHASEKRKTGQTEENNGNIADLLNDARNAAKAAASDAAIAEMLEEEAKRKKKDDLKSGFVGVIKKRRKALMLATAVILVVAVSIPFASRFLGSDARLTEITAPASQISDPIPDEEGGQSDEGSLAMVDDEENVEMKAETEIEVQETAETTDMASAAMEDNAVEMTKAEDMTNVSSDMAAATAMVSETPVEETKSTASEVSSTESGISNGADKMDGDSQPEMMASKAEVEEETTNSTVSGSMEAGSEIGRAITVAPMPPAEVGNIVLRQAAAKGDGKALFEVARRYTEGEGVNRDLSEASKWYELSAGADYAPGQYRYANFLEKGHGGNSDIAGAAKWYQKAAENGNALAMHNLAVLYTSGLVDGTPNMKKAIDWFEKAAALGVKDSQVNLGIINAQGLGLTADLTEAYKWFAIAAKGGDTDAAGKRDSIANAMLPEKLAEARGAAELWKPVALDPAANVPSIQPEWKSLSGKQATLTEKEMILKTQQLLAQKGYDPGPADGLMGERTRQAIRSFKKQAGMPDDASVSAELLKRLSDGSA